MAVALLTSLVRALSFTPVLAERFVKAKRRPGWKENPDQRRDHEAMADERVEQELHGRILGGIIRRYDWVLGLALDNRWAVLIVVALVLAGSFLLYRSLGSEFLPEFDENASFLAFWAPPGAPLTETNRILLPVQNLLRLPPDAAQIS